MVRTKLQGPRIAGVASAVPETIRDLNSLETIFGQEDIRKISDSSGVLLRRIAPPDGSICTSDLCAAAAERLLTELNWDRQTIDGLIFVSQTPDYVLPATACSLHGRLNLSKTCASFDINLGCSGYIYGLWLAASMISSGGCNRVLLLVGDTISRIASPFDRAVSPLFGDAGTATALERAAESNPLCFQLGTDGTGSQNLIVPAGGFRRPRSIKTAERTPREGGNIRSDEDLYMNGGEIFAFTLREIPSLILGICKDAGWRIEDVNSFLFHQANRFMLQHLAKKMKLPTHKMVIALENFGNTSSASIPLALTQCLSARLKFEKMRLVLAGFGVGYSWGAVSLICGPIAAPELIIVSSLPAEENADAKI